MHNHRHILITLFLVQFVMLFVSCKRESHIDVHIDGNDTSISATDTLEWLPGRDYERNFNFLVRSDTLQLIVQSPEEVLADFPTDTFPIPRNSVIAAVDFRILSADSIDSVWVRVACSSEEMGWIHESNLLAQVSPDDPISQFIDFFTDTHRKIGLIFVLLILAAYIFRIISRREAFLVHFKDINSFYPTLLTLLVALAATTYATIQHFTPEVWHHYYFHPSLNPFTQPLLLAFFLFLFWMLIITAIAAIDDAIRLLVPSTALLYLLGLFAVCAICYVVFSLTTLIWIGYPLLIAYIVFALRRYFHHNRTHYICGYCGHRIKQKGRCPHCNAINE